TVPHKPDALAKEYQPIGWRFRLVCPSLALQACMSFAGASGLCANHSCRCSIPAALPTCQLIQLHPRLQDRLDADRGLHAFEIRVLDMPLDLATDFRERLFRLCTVPRRIGLATDQVDDGGGIIENLVRGQF